MPVRHPRLAYAGLDLIEFPTIVWFETDCSIYTMRQASRRSWRIGQTEPVKVVFMAYRNTLQADALKLVAQKLQSSLAVESELPEDGLAAYGEDGDDLMLALARKLVSGEQAADSVESVFAQAQRVAADAEALLVDDGWQRSELDTEPLVVAFPQTVAPSRWSSWFHATDTTVRWKRSRRCSLRPSSWPNQRNGRSVADARFSPPRARCSSGRWRESRAPDLPLLPGSGHAGGEVVASMATTSPGRVWSLSSCPARNLPAGWSLVIVQLAHRRGSQQNAAANLLQTAMEMVSTSHDASGLQPSATTNRASSGRGRPRPNQPDTRSQRMRTVAGIRLSNNASPPVAPL